MNKRTLILALALGLSAAPAAAAPGAADDPLVSKSYIDEVVFPYVNDAVASGSGGLKIVELSPGERLSASSGAEIVLRSGAARAVASARGGLCDVTAGIDVGQGQAVAANHLLLVPRADGRGLLADTAATLMVRGDYTVD